MANTNLLEVRSSSGYLMHKIFYAKDVAFSKIFLDNCVVSDRNALFVDLAVTALVDQFADRLEIRLAGIN